MASNNGADSTAQTRFKIQPRRVNCDDCLVFPDRQVSSDGKVVTDGAGVPVHLGEWVDVMPVQSMRELILLGQIATQSGGEDSGEAGTSSKTQAGIARASKAGEALEALCTALSARVVAWNWTDNAGVLLPQPYQRPDILEALSNDELMYLLQATRGETPDERKKDSAPLAPISLATDSTNPQK